MKTLPFLLMIFSLLCIDIVLADSKWNVTMTAYNSPSPYVVQESNSISSTFAGWKVFDKIYNSSSGDNYWQPLVDSISNEWVKIDMGGSYSMLAYGIDSYNYPNYRPQSWTLEGSNDSSAWTLLDARSSYTWSSQGAEDYFSITTPNPYRYYRWNFTATNYGPLVIEEIDLFSYTTPSMNCTSCNYPTGDVNPPYETDDTTPTFTFYTANASVCRIADTNFNYTTMGSSRNCDYGQNLLAHTCTLTAQDGLVDYNTSAYISCNYSESTNATFALPMLISSLDTPNSSEAIQQGIDNSVIGLGATVYTNQKVYLRALNGSTFTSTVDKVAVYGNQRWIFNYENSTALGLFNLTPVVYSLDMKNMTIKAIRANVTACINSTKI